MKKITTSLCALTLLFSSVSQAEVLLDKVEERVSRTNETLTYTFFDLAEHDTVTLNFDFFMFDSWDLDNVDYSDTFAFSLDQYQYIYGPTFEAWGGNPRTNPELVQGSFNNIETWGPIDVYFENFMGGFTFSHSAETLTLSFTGSNLQDITDESWAVDNISLSTNSAFLNNSAITSDVAAPLILGSIGLFGMLFARKRV